MAGAEIRRFSSDRRGLALNYFLGIASGALSILADTLVQVMLVLPVFVALVSGSNVAIGWVPVIGIGLWSLVRLVTANLTAGQRRQLPWATASALVQTAAIGLLAYVAYNGGDNPDRLRRAFFICFVAYAIAGGLSAVPTAAVVGRSIPDEARPRFYRQRAFWGGVLAIVAGLVVARLLSDDGPSFPRNFALLFLAAAVCLGAASFFILSLREPSRTSLPKQAGLVDALRVAPSAAADPNYRRFLAFRLVLAGAAVIDPFYIVYAVRNVGLEISVVGLYVIILVVARLIGRLGADVMSSRMGDRSVLQLAALARFIIPLVAMLVPYLLDAGAVADRVDDQRLVAVVFGIVVAIAGLAAGAHERTVFSYLFDIAPAPLRLGYTALTNLALALATTAALAAGAIVDREGFRTLFLLAAGLGFVAIMISGAVTDTDVRPRATAAAWRLRRTALRAPHARR